MVRNLFDLTGDMLDLLEALSSDDPSVVQQAADAVELTAETYLDKLAGYIRVIESLEIEAAQAKAQADYLSKLADQFKATDKARSAARKRLLERINESLTAIGVDSAKTAAGKIRVQLSPYRLVPTRPDATVPERFLIQQPPKPDNKALLSAITDGERIDGWTAERGTHVRIYR